jgi:hypothetical protein
MSEQPLDQDLLYSRIILNLYFLNYYALSKGLNNLSSNSILLDGYGINEK